MAYSLFFDGLAVVRPIDRPCFKIQYTLLFLNHRKERRAARAVDKNQQGQPWPTST
jgi:hypothetical protein